MSEWGERLRARARELGLSDTDVAKRLGLAQSRYANYVNQNREPDFATLVRICRVLDTTPNHVLGFEGPDSTEIDGRSRGRAALEALEQPVLNVAVIMLEAIAARQADLTLTKP